MTPISPAPEPPAESPGLKEARRVLQMEAEAILAMAGRLDRSFEASIDLLAACTGRVVTTGMGKSGIMARKMAATFSSTGTPALFLHPAEAAHGDLGCLVAGDVLIAVSYSGETGEISRMLEVIKRLGIPLIALCGRPDSTLARYADLFLDAGVEAEACPLGLAPTSSTTAALAMGDALAMGLLTRKGFRIRDFAAVHPGGRLGSRLRRVSQVMHTGREIPTVQASASLLEVMDTMTRGRLGIAVVKGSGDRVEGLITDGDLRRLLQGKMSAPRQDENLRDLPASRIMTRTPRTISPEALASEALHLMETNKITSLIVVGAEGRLQGVVHLHDLWRTELI
ncbi:MAG: SIS domain-containing protein [Acidobacteriota bacterium]